MSDKANVQCPKCGGQQMWDNRLTKKNPKQPDFKCVDRACDGVIWPPKGAVAAAPAPAPTAPAKVAHSSGPYIPAIDGPNGLDAMFATYNVCLDQAIQSAKKLETAGIGSDPQAVAAMCATLFIAAGKLPA